MHISVLVGTLVLELFIIPHPDLVEHRAHQAERDHLHQLIEPVAGLIERQVPFKGQDGVQPARVQEEVDLEVVCEVR